MAQPDAGVNQGTSYSNSAPAADQNQNVAQDQGDNGVWDDPTWRWGDHWAWWGWHRPYGYRSHWSWGTRAEWSTNGGDFSSGSPGEGDEDWGSGGRHDEHPSYEPPGHDSDHTDYRRRASWNSSGFWTGDSSTRAPNTSGDGNPGQEAAPNKGSFSEKMAVPGFDAQSTGEDLGMSARSYLRQVDAWCKVTRTPKT